MPNPGVVRSSLEFEISVVFHIQSESISTDSSKPKFVYDIELYWVPANANPKLFENPNQSEIDAQFNSAKSYLN